MEVERDESVRDHHLGRQPWLEYSQWRGQDWVKIFMREKAQTWYRNTCRVWEPVLPEGDALHQP